MCLPTAAIRLSKVHACSGPEAGDGNVPTKLEGSQTSTQWARERSQDAIIYPSSPPSKKPPTAVPWKGRKKKQSVRQTKQNNTGEPENNHKAPWPYVTNQKTRCHTSGSNKGDRCPLGSPLYGPLACRGPLPAPLQTLANVQSNSTNNSLPHGRSGSFDTQLCTQGSGNESWLTDIFNGAECRTSLQTVSYLGESDRKFN